MHNTNSQVSVSIGDLIEAAGFQTPLYRPVMYRFPEKIKGVDVEQEIVISGPSARQWEFQLWQFPANNLSRKVINNVPILLTTVEVNPLQLDSHGKVLNGREFDSNGNVLKEGRFGFKALNPGLHICDNPECKHPQRFTTDEQRVLTKVGRGHILCQSGQGCKGIMTFHKVTQTVDVPQDITDGLRNTYAEGCIPQLTAHPPEIYMILATPSKCEWCAYDHVAEVRAKYKNADVPMDLVPWKQGLIAGETPAGATVILPQPKYRLGWEAEETLYGHRDMGYAEQFIYVRKPN